MQMTATVNYHISSSEPQAFHIDADGEKGKILSPVLVPVQVDVKDVRDGDLPSDFHQDSVSFVFSPTGFHDFEEQQAWESEYDRELRDLLTRDIGAREVIVFDHTVRIDDPNAGRKPARNVHSDYSPKGAHQRLRDIVGDDNAEDWEAGHFGFVNVWRPVRRPIASAPLGFVRPKSVRPEDWVTLDLIYPDRTGQIMGLVRNRDHEWIYQSRMSPDEAAIFNIYDNRGLPSIAHSAMDMVEDPSVRAPRMSVESRTLVRY